MNNLLLKEYFLKNTLKISFINYLLEYFLKYSFKNIYLDTRYIYIKNVFK